MNTGLLWMIRMIHPSRNLSTWKMSSWENLKDLQNQSRGWQDDHGDYAQYASMKGPTGRIIIGWRRSDVKSTKLLTSTCIYSNSQLGTWIHMFIYICENMEMDCELYEDSHVKWMGWQWDERLRQMAHPNKQDDNGMIGSMMTWMIKKYWDPNKKSKCQLSPQSWDDNCCTLGWSGSLSSQSSQKPQQVCIDIHYPGSKTSTSIQQQPKMRKHIFQAFQKKTKRKNIPNRYNNLLKTI